MLLALEVFFRTTISANHNAIHRLLLVAFAAFLTSISLVVNAQTYPVPAMVAPSSGTTVIQTGQNPCFSWTRVTDARFKSYVITL